MSGLCKSKMGWEWLKEEDREFRGQPWLQNEILFQNNKIPDLTAFPFYRRGQPSPTCCTNEKYLTTTFFHVIPDFTKTQKAKTTFQSPGWVRAATEGS